ncbi:MAG: hypothetical protein WDN75_21435 [Bacteroidota bacterium]
MILISGQESRRRWVFDSFSGYTFANQELVRNMIAYLSDDAGLISARNKDVKVRPLDKEKIKNDRLMWQSINLVLPIVVILFFGIAKAYFRKRKYGGFERSAADSARE